MIDLGGWLGERYAIPGDPGPDPDPDLVDAAQKGERSRTPSRGRVTPRSRRARR
jgi:hypothetical protein